MVLTEFKMRPVQIHITNFMLWLYIFMINDYAYIYQFANLNITLHRKYLPTLIKSQDFMNKTLQWFYNWIPKQCFSIVMGILIVKLWWLRGCLNGNAFTSKMSSLYWDCPDIADTFFQIAKLCYLLTLLCKALYLNSAAV